MFKVNNLQVGNCQTQKHSRKVSLSEDSDCFQTLPVVEQHIHGAYGVNFNTCDTDDVLELAKKLKQKGVGTFYPTLVTDTLKNLRNQIEIIFSATKKQTKEMAKIAGIHLEAVFLNKEQSGAHDENLFMEPLVKNYKQLEHEFIKIVTLAPELCKPKDSEINLMDYLKEHNIKVQAGHCEAGDLSKCDGVTHTYNAMLPVRHRGDSTTLQALVNDRLYAEIIPDGHHVYKDALTLLFRSKPSDKILLVSDCLPCAYTNTNDNYEFAGSKIINNGEFAKNDKGKFAGSVRLVPDMVKTLNNFGIVNSAKQVQQLMQNFYDYHNLEPEDTDTITWSKKTYEVIS